ncbi:MAG: hypothetical protein JWR59_2223 [Brevundimonas sp.]|nr:hypothetical protein [Brevundimonas sp.]
MRVSALTAVLIALPVSLALGSAGPAPSTARDVQATPATPEPARPERQCFSPQQVQNFRSAGPTTVYLKVGANTVYELQTAGGCNDLEGAYQLSIQPELGSRLCSGDWANIVVPGSARPLERCRVQITKVLSAEEVAALPDRSRP